MNCAEGSVDVTTRDEGKATRAGNRAQSKSKAGDSAAISRLQRRIQTLERDLERAKLAGAKSSAESKHFESVHRSILAAVLDPTITIDHRGVIVTASRSVQRVFGWRPRELIGKNISVLIPEPHHSKHDNYLARYRRTGETNILNRTREFEAVRKDGSLVPIELSVSRVDPNGSAAPLFTGSFRDISERKASERALRDSEARFHAIFENSFQYIGLLSPEGVLLEANQTSLDSAGIRRSDVIGKPFWEGRWWNVSEAARERVKQAVKAAAKGEFVRFDAEHRGAGDEIRTVDFSLKPVRDESGKVIQLIPEGRDITELKRAQRAETSMLRAFATVGESAAMLAHEIKNPITAVNVALRAVAEQLGEDHKQVIEDLVSRMQRLEQLMRRTLTFTKPIDLRLATLDCGELVAKSIAPLRTQIVKSGCRLELHRPEERLLFEGDRQLLEEVITNLVRNAVEALPSGGTIEVTVERTDNAHVRISIEDDGPGIAETVRATLFQPFVTTKSQGTGLGLPFCKKVIEQHGGTIAAGASALGGARFALELPIQ